MVANVTAIALGFEHVYALLILVVIRNIRMGIFTDEIIGFFPSPCSTLMLEIAA